ncbi:MAG: acetate--CoA ligase family protein, partial [Archaeoglobales archaeon]|nr:acetate--CoA ligase family protein [Archaeoglobales archaeon]
AKSLGFPVVMKVNGILHKSDVGGVILNLKTEEEVRNAFRRLSAIEGARGVNVQPQLSGIELIIGSAENEQFGSYLMFGLGGVFVEVLRDVSFRLIPLSREEAYEMIREIKGYKILEGYRGFKANVSAVVDLLLKVSEIVENESIVEMDLNPVFANENGCFVADARIVKGKRRSFDCEARDISFFFTPRSVAVVGASRTPGKPGNNIVWNLKSMGYPGKIYPVNVSAEEIHGYKCYKSVKEIPEEIDLAIIAVPSKNAVEVVEECAEKGAKGLVVISGGFAEGWEKGKELEEEIVRIARSRGMMIIGPNTMGVLDPRTRFTSFFSPFISMVTLKPGNIGVIAQSGAFANFMIISLHHVGISKSIAIGNKADVNELDALEFLLKDEHTKVIAMYLEGFVNGRKLFETLRRAKKPVVILKSGRTEAGKRSALSHTASISTGDELFDSICRQAGALKVNDYEELADTVKALALSPIPKGDRIGVIQPSGAECVISADAVVEAGLRLAKFSEKTLEKLYELAPEWHTINNPIDLYPLLERSGDEVIFEVIRLLCEDQKVDAVISGIFIPSIFGRELNLSWIKQYRKPVLITLKDDLIPVKEIKLKIEEEFPVYPTPERAVRAIKNMLRFQHLSGET